jgi:membrane protease YdiL (CAAX protease family)
MVWQAVQGIGVVIHFFLTGRSHILTENKGEEAQEDLTMALMDGDLVGTLAFVSIFFVCPLAWIIGKVKRPWGGWEYLGAARTSWWQWLIWLLLTLVLGASLNLLSPLLGISEMHDSMVTMTRTTQYPILLILGIAVGAPLVEEFIFRGVAYRGWRESPLGMWGTIIFTTVLWGLLHMQYFNEPWILGFLFLFGILLALAREKTGNIWVPVAMHALNNSLAVFYMLQANLA